MSSADVYLHSLSTALGEHDVDLTASWQAGRLCTDPTTLQQHGFQRHRLAADDTEALDLALRACRPMGEAIATSDVLVYATALPLNSYRRRESQFAQSRDIKDLANFPASRLQAELGLERAAVVGLTQQACTAMLGAIRLARALLLAEPHLAQVLCVAADRFPPGARYEQAYSPVSDAACAGLVSRQPVGYRIIACHALSNGALAQASDDEMAGTHFAYAHQIIQETLDRAGLRMADIAWIVPQNTSRQVWQILGPLLQHPLERVALGTLAQAGHAISADNVLNLCDLEASGKIKPGDRLLLFMASFGMNWQGLVLEKVGPA
ncbi:MAG: 3-oxoacyl-[acyl-carrier-protein] synthase III C-terminal domain-containing protein [Candidatus Sericytochromatia bacterium]|nr:3-oxoacyl-[acyl-carrier-protein] synthase III C-terminal domain-containing protein [Candidatus Sericytochromatia bacterium]